MQDVAGSRPLVQFSERSSCTIPSGSRRQQATFVTRTPDAGGVGERRHVIGVGAQDSIAVAGKQYQPAVDGVGSSRRGQQQAGGSPLSVRHSGNLDALQEPCEISLASLGVAPDLGDDRRTRPQIRAAASRGCDACDRRPLSTIHRDESPRIKDECAHGRSGG